MANPDPVTPTALARRVGRCVGRGVVVPCALYLFAYYALTWPAMHSMGSALLGDGGDGWQNVWNLWSVRRALVAGHNPWFTDMLFAPDGVTLVGATLNPINGFLAVPLGVLFNELQTYNLLVVFAFVTTGWTTMLLLRQMKIHYWPAMLGGAAFTFSSYHMAHGLGHMQLITLQYVPLFLWSWLRLLDRPSIAGGITAGLFLMLVQWSDHYYTLYCVLAGGSILIVRTILGGRPAFFRWRELAWPTVAFVTTSVCTLSPLALALVVDGERDPWIGSHHSSSYVNDLLGPFIPGSNWQFRGLTEWFWHANPFWENRVAEFNNFIAPTVLVLAACGCWWLRASRARRAVFVPWIVVGVVFFLLSLGPCVQVMARSFDQAFTPYHALAAVFPPLQLGGMPVRFSVMYLLAAAILAALGAQAFFRTRRRRRWLAAPLLALLFLDLKPWSTPVTIPPDSTVVRQLASLPDGLVVGIPWDRYGPWWQVMHGKPMPYGYISRYPTSVHARGRKLETLAKRRAYRALLRETGARYVLAPIHHPRGSLEREGFALLAGDDRFELYVDRRDPLAPGGTEFHDRPPLPSAGPPRTQAPPCPGSKCAGGTPR